ncbi:CHAT domain-containing protein [Aerosakkonemataceae cyanobacterium BLCC-F154]|uniref:CHAT domain-containing protein n=1 Tax=Floridaenema fluviatile BLCC-F154 TaxID=3153640 RepID=A0ABV4YHI7_9CYAN
MSATISLVIITYNREHYLSAAVESVLAQTKHDFELLIWDDGSTDNSLEIAQNYAKNDRRVKVIAGKHQGETLSRKAAISQTTGEYLGWLDSDDLIAPTALEETAKLLDLYPEVGLVYTDYIDISETGEIIGYGERCQIPYSPENLLLDFITFHFRLFRRSVFEQVGGIDESVKYAPDYDLCLKLSEVTQVRHINKPLYYYRNHSKSITHQQQLEVIRYSEKIINQALERRGLNRTHSLNVQLQEINGQIQSKFYLINKENPEKLSSQAKKKEKILACAFFLSYLSLFNINPAFADPIVPAKDGTNTIVNPQGNRFDITGGQRSSDGANLFHSFTRFGLNNQQIANFLSQPNIRNILARVNGGEISYINGLIQITGGNSNLFLMNPSGVVFGANARLNVPAAFTATTANGIGFGNNWFNATGNNNYATLVGDPNAFAFTMQQPGAIINSGDLAVGLGQDLNLLAGTIINTGTLTAPQGNITVTAVPGTSLVRLSQPGFLLSLEVQQIENSVTQPNSFDLPIATLPQMLTGGNGSNATGVIVNQDGSVELIGSGIRIPSEGNTAIVSGKIDASGETGGNINILGDKVGVINSNINASGTKDGGNVRIGGDYKGQGKLPNASRVLISNDTIINVDSSTVGNGGKAIIWSDKATAFHGKVSAKGGNNSGDGGFVEVSSADVLVFQGDVDTSAPNGKIGTLLIDPSFLIISDTLGGATTIGGGVGDQDSNLTTDNQILFGDPDQPQNTVTWKAIASLANDANVVLEATGDITIEDIVGGTFGITQNNLVDLNLDTGSLRITSTNGAVIFQDTGDKIRTQGGAITVQALGGNLTGGSFDTTGIAGDKSGDISLEAQGELQVNQVITGGGNINITANKDVILNNKNFPSELVSSGTNGGGNISVISTNGSILAAGAGAGYGNIIAKGGSGVGGNVSLKAFSKIDMGAIDTTGDAGKGEILLTGNEINFNSSVAGGVVTLEPSPNTEAIRIAGDETDNLNVLDISPNDLDNLADIDELIIGSTEGSGDITVDPAGVTFNSPVTIQSGTGNITANGEIVVFNDGTLTINTGGNITTKDVIANAGINITSTGGNIDSSGGTLDTSNEGDTGSISLDAAGDITTGDIITTSFGGDKVGDISLTSSGGTINTSAGIIDTSTTGNTGGSVLLDSPVNIILGNISTEGDIAGGDVNFNGKVTLNKDVNITTGADISGDINFTGTVDGTQKLTLEAGTGTISFNAVVGETTPLGKLDITSAGNIELAGSITTADSDIIFNAPVTVLGESSLNAGTATINVNKNLDAGDNQLTLTADEINFKGGTASVSGTNKLILQPATPSSNITIGGKNEQDISPALTLTSTDISALENGFSSIVIGREDGSGTISLIGDVTFNDPVTWQSPVGAGSIDNTGFSLTGKDDASVTLLANFNITMGDITAPKGISITSNNGAINTTSGTLNSSAISDSDAGEITLKAAGNITTSNLTAQGNSDGGNGGKVSITSTGGSVDTSAGLIDTRTGIIAAGTTGNGGAVTINAKGDIITGSIFSLVGEGSIGNAGSISLNSETGKIDTSEGRIDAGTTFGNGGEISFNALGDILTKEVLSYVVNSGEGDGGIINFNSTEGGINTTAGDVNSSSDNGNGGAVIFTAKGDIVTANIISASRNNGSGGDIFVSSSAGLIDSSAGSLNSASANGNAGDVSLISPESIIVGAINANGLAETGNISLTSDKISFTGEANSIQGKGNLLLQPFTPSQNLDISTVNFDILAEGFASITIGAENGSGVVSIPNAIAFSDPVIIQSPDGKIIVNGAITGTDNASITLNGTTNLNADITTAEQDINLIGSVLLGKDVTLNTGETAGGDIFVDGTIDGNQNLTLATGTGDINLNNAVGSSIALNDLTINSANNFVATSITAASITQKSGTGVTILGDLNTNSATGINLTGNTFVFNGKVTTTNNGGFTINNASPLTLDAAIFNLDGAFKQIGEGAVSLSGNLTTTNDDISFQSAVTLIGDTSLNTGAGIGDITFNNTVDGAGNLSLNAGIGNVNLAGEVGNNTRLGNLIFESATDVNAKAITAASITQKLGTGTSTFGNLNTNSETGINLTGNSFIFNGKVTTTNNGGFTISNANPLTIDAGIFNLDGAFKQTGEGAISLTGNLTTTNDDISFQSVVTLIGDTSLNTGVGIGDITFNNTVNGAVNLSLNAGTGNVNLVGEVGNNTRLGNLIIESATDVNAKAITAASITQKSGTGTSTFGDLNTDSETGINLTGNSFVFNGKVITTNNGSFTISNASPLTIDGKVFNLDGAFKQIGEGAVSLSGNLTTTNDNISFQSAVTLIGDTFLNTGLGIGDITFNNSVDGGSNLSLNAGIGNVNFGGAVGSNTRLGNLTIESATDVNANAITAASITQKSGNGVTNLGDLNTNTSQGINLIGSAFNLNGTVTTINNGGLTINNSGALNLKSDINLDSAFNQIGNGEVSVLGSITTTNDDIRFNSFITLTGNTKFNPGTGTIAFNSGLFAGTNSLILRAGEVIFGGKVTGSGDLTLEPADPNQKVAIADTIPGAFNLSASTLANLENGFNSITIGRIDGTGLVSVKEVTFNDPITIRSGSGTINVNGAIIGKDNALITLDAAILNLNANLKTDNQNITLGRIIQLGNDVKISTGLGVGDITFNGSVDGTKQLNLVAGGGNIRFNAAVGKNLPLSKLNISTNSKVFVSQGINTTNELTINAPVILTENAVFSAGSGSITFGNTVDSELGEANNLTLSAVNGSVTFNGAVGSKGQEIGNILINNAKDLTANSPIKAQQLQQNAGTGNVNLKANVTTSGAGVELNTTGDIRTSNITAKGGNISANSKNGIIETGNLDASNTGIGGTITLISPKAITTGNLTATGVEKGGTVIVKSGDRITTANIDVSATIGNGGTVFIDPPNDVQVGFINAQGGNQGIGGKVDITTESFFRSTASFVDNKGVNSSISTAGGTGNGSIIIRHGGGSLKTPFVVGNASKNGTAGALTTGKDIIAPTQSFPGSFTLGNIQIITKDFPIDPKNPNNPIINEIAQVIQQQENISEIPRILVTQVPPVPIDTILAVAEETFSEEFAAYLGFNFSNNIRSLEDISTQLRRNEEETGVRSAVLYVVFRRGGEQGSETLVTCPPDSGNRVQNSSLEAENCQEKDSDRVELFLITPEGKPVRLPVENVTKSEVLNLARQLQMEVTDGTKLETTSYLPPAQALYKLLIAPIEGKLQEQGIKNLIFIPDAGLRSLPLAALHDGNGFIVERYSVSLMPSFSLTNPRFYNLKNSTVLAMGASIFKEQIPLPAVPVELSTIARQLWSGNISLNEAFTVNNLTTQRNAGNFEIVHLATHAEFRPGTPSNSYIQFWDEKLGLDQVRNVKWNEPPVQLLVLSACRTALGDRQVELGFAGIAIQAGVQSALASLWYVSDQGTLALMTEFYEQLKTAPIRAEALRRAQVAMIKGEVIVNKDELEGIGETGITLPPELRQSGKVNFSHPYYWSGFTLIGNPW